MKIALAEFTRVIQQWVRIFYHIMFSYIWNLPLSLTRPCTQIPSCEESFRDILNICKGLQAKLRLINQTDLAAVSVHDEH